MGGIQPLHPLQHYNLLSFDYKLPFKQDCPTVMVLHDSQHGRIDELTKSRTSYHFATKQLSLLLSHNGCGAPFRRLLRCTQVFTGLSLQTGKFKVSSNFDSDWRDNSDSRPSIASPCVSCLGLSSSVTPRHSLFLDKDLS